MAFYVYMLASGRNGTLYVGQTDDLIARVHQHREKAMRGFTARYDVDASSGSRSVVIATEHCFASGRSRSGIELGSLS